jgi:FkbM family methyltransferase
LGLRGTRRIAMSLYSPYDRSNDYISSTVRYQDGLIQIDTRSFIEWWIYIFGGFETGAIDQLRRLVHPGAVVIDVGANVGAFTLPLARAAGRQGRVHAFEPHPVVRARLLENLALNNLRNVTVLDCALGAKPGRTTLYVPIHANQGQASLMQRPGLDDQVSCAIDTLDNYVAALGSPRVDLIKIDTEGAEYLVLSGASKLLSTSRPCVYVEVSPDYLANFGASARQVAELLSGHGYDIWQNESVEIAALRKSLKLKRMRAFEDLPAHGLDYYWLAVHRDAGQTAHPQNGV